MQLQKFRHFFFNRYLLNRFSERRYFLSIDYQHKILRFRIAKVGTRSINTLFKEATRPDQYISGTATAYVPQQFQDYFKFAFVRELVDRFQSAWRNKVQGRNYFRLSEERDPQMQEIENFVDWAADLDIHCCDLHLRAQSALIDLDELGFLGRFEHFNQDMRFVTEKLGQKPGDLPHKNYTKRQKRAALSPALPEKIAAIYRHDYDLLYS